MARGVGLAHSPSLCCWDGPGSPNRILCFESLCACYDVSVDGTVELNRDKCNCENLTPITEKARLALDYIFKPEALIKFPWREIMHMMQNMADADQDTGYLETI
jgi:hypothetical protein